jgi:hypothetical protein
MTKRLASELSGGGGPRRVLCLDGGGVRGLLTLGVLSELEITLRKRAGDDSLVLSARSSPRRWLSVGPRLKSRRSTKR